MEILFVCPNYEIVMKIGLYAHGGSGNHGCEAIVRSTLKLLGGNEYTIFSERPDDDIYYGLDKFARVVASQAGLPKGIEYLVYLTEMKLLRNDQVYWRKQYRTFENKIKGLDLALAIGGDNYCYNGFTERFAILNKALKQKRIPIILWGCSIDKERICSDMLKDLRRFNLIIARESITYNNLKQAGLSKVLVMPDTAFLLEENEKSLPEGFKSGNTVGLNISPLVIRQEKAKGIVMKNCNNLIEFILGETDMHIALIPHVVWEGNDDREPLCKLYEKYHSTNRIIMVEDADAPTLKTIIHNCRFMVASRTHASIAGYSTGVPTLTIGYSVKSFGIASDLFGSAAHYVLPVTDIKDEEKLKNAFTWLTEHENNIRKHYDLKLGDYLSRLKKNFLDELS